VKRSEKSRVKRNKSSEAKETMQNKIKNILKQKERKTASIYFCFAKRNKKKITEAKQSK
jgi:hypothetical protein